MGIRGRTGIGINAVRSRVSPMGKSRVCSMVINAVASRVSMTAISVEINAETIKDQNPAAKMETNRVMLKGQKLATTMGTSAGTAPVTTQIRTPVPMRGISLETIGMTAL